MRDLLPARPWTLVRTTGMLALLISMLNEKRVISDTDLAELFDKSGEIAGEEARRSVSG